MNKLKISDFDVCLYHSGCPDGIGAAWCLWRENRINKNTITRRKAQKSIDTEGRLLKEICIKTLSIHGVRYNEPFPENIIKGKKVIIVDFSYDRESIKEMCEISEYIFILDHHDTAQRELEGLEEELPNFSCIFDMLRSGVQITWDWCYPNEPRPWFVEVIADRDLWKWTYPNSKEIGKALYHYGWYNFDGLEKLYTSEEKEELHGTFLEQGKILTELEKREISRAVTKSVLCDFEGYKVMITSCSHLIRSEVGSILSEKRDCDFAMTWRYDFETDQWWISIRGIKSCNIPLNVLCEKYGGGGHQKACGFAIHDSGSNEWIDATEEERSKMAYGNLHNYFTILRGSEKLCECGEKDKLICEKGKIILKDLEKREISYAVTKSVLCEFQGYKIRSTSCSHFIQSDVGRVLSQKGDCDLAMTWRYEFEVDRWFVSLWSTKSCKIPLDILCAKYGGGDHQKGNNFIIYGFHSKEWLNMTDKECDNMAYGNLHHYFKVI